MKLEQGPILERILEMRDPSMRPSWQLNCEWLAAVVGGSGDSLNRQKKRLLDMAVSFNHHRVEKQTAYKQL